MSIKEVNKAITGDPSEQDRDDLAKRAAKMAVLVKSPDRARAAVTRVGYGRSTRPTVGGGTSTSEGGCLKQHEDQLQKGVNP
jgi:hypothetical protein